MEQWGIGKIGVVIGIIERGIGKMGAGIRIIARRIGNMRELIGKSEQFSLI
ncbi:hypothetical protein [Sporosarcina aquimarina]|uniref:Uncharacterized protein n=1 Tax=Sporosarcina aquimarina TaxID=114975 RepID=A0ABU4G1E5_9BACL|nr:hypothetical protein [Sporosarcina aquimarina]MDW0110789.1 hypothetical protein [Sporosarcina aquimarina]